MNQETLSHQQMSGSNQAYGRISAPNETYAHHMHVSANLVSLLTCQTVGLQQFAAIVGVQAHCMKVLGTITRRAPMSEETWFCCGISTSEQSSNPGLHAAPRIPSWTHRTASGLHIKLKVRTSRAGRAVPSPNWLSRSCACEINRRSKRGGSCSGDWRFDKVGPQRWQRKRDCCCHLPLQAPLESIALALHNHRLHL